ncbi:uncharacterized protein LOC116186324 isoform X2 [Apis dorsata]|uniref:uncharacterized protein LOC116186324 isoform X2 n=1 Tax=Apis dorsata TaxID=7462 RepID=UPI001293A1A0|nr:uncharacterized protein LOC116186324 isoform X2 [Apis dorsata]
MTSTSDMNRLRVMRSSYGFLAAPAVATRSARTPAATYNPAVGTCLPCAYSRHIVSPIASATCPPSSSVSRNYLSNANTFIFLLIRPFRFTGSTVDYFSPVLHFASDVSFVGITLIRLIPRLSLIA